jgi:hypothetical protein
MWMTAIVGVSALRLTMYASQLPGPWIIPDELLYAELGRSAAESAAFTIRDEATRVYALLYPALISPAYLLWDAPESSYRAVKAINAIAMSFAAVPVYFLARRFASSGWAVAMAALAVAIPSMAYTGVVMTENLFYPLFVLAALAMVAALERPTARRQLLLLGAVGAATLTRPQAIVILPAFASALLLVKLVESRTRTTADSDGGSSIRFRSYRLLWILPLAAALGALALSAIRGASPLGVLGVYQHALGAVGVADAMRTLLYQFAVLDLSVGVIPFAAALAVTLLAVRGGISSSLLRVWAVTVSLTVWMLALVAVVGVRADAGGPGYPALPPQIHERWFFFLAPLFFLLTLGFLQQRREGIRGSVVLAAAVAGLLPAILPIEEFEFNAQFESLALVPWLDTSSADGPAPIVFAAALAALFVAACRRNRVGLSLIIVGLVLYGTGFTAQNGMLDASEQIAGRAGASDPSWIDHAVGPGENVVVVLGASDAPRSQRAKFDWGLPVWYSEFFNTSLGRVYYLGEQQPYNLPDERVTVDGASGSLLDSSRRPLRSSWALADTNIRLEGDVVARLDSGFRLYRISGSRLRVAG